MAFLQPPESQSAPPRPSVLARDASMASGVSGQSSHPMNVVDRFRHLSHEMAALKDQVWNLIGNAHGGESGSWREAILRQVLRRHLPETVRVGSGFIVTKDRSSPQIDILIYETAHPTLFRQGDVAIVTPDAVRGVIEVKSCISSFGSDSKTLAGALHHLSKCGEMLPHRPFLGLFAYECRLANPQRTVNCFSEAAAGDRTKAVAQAALGPDRFVRFWPQEPGAPDDAPAYERWHSYTLHELAFGYFVSNVVDQIRPVSEHLSEWFPEKGEGTPLSRERPLRASLEV